MELNILLGTLYLEVWLKGSIISDLKKWLQFSLVWRIMIQGGEDKKDMDEQRVEVY